MSYNHRMDDCIHYWLLPRQGTETLIKSCRDCGMEKQYEITPAADIPMGRPRKKPYMWSISGRGGRPKKGTRL